MSQYPTEWQRKILWSTATALAVVAVGAAVVWLIYLFGQVISFLQPVLIPFAVAAVLAFLLDPIVRVITARTRLSRTPAVIVVLSLVVLFVALLVIAVVPQIYDSSARVIRDMPAYTKKAQQRLLTLVEISERKINQLNKLFPVPKASPSPTPALDEPATPPPGDTGPAASDAAATPAPEVVAQASLSPSPAAAAAAGTDSTGTPADGSENSTGLRDYIQKQLPEVGRQVPAVLNTGWHLVLRSIGGFLGAFGLLLNAIIIPVYLYFLLVESRNIARNWSGFLPMHDSPRKQEVVSVILEINGYLVAFFRGQLLVSTIDGILIGSALYFGMHLDFSFFIALLVIVLTFIPYLGIILCYIPALLIAVVQFGDWGHPFGVVAIMFIVQMLESTIISPKIVGDSVGLHPMTVIISVFAWSLLLDGPIGAILAVPLTATLKVLMRRYVWERETVVGRRLVPLTAASAVTLDEVSRQAREGEEAALATTAAAGDGKAVEAATAGGLAFSTSAAQPVPAATAGLTGEPSAGEN